MTLPIKVPTPEELYRQATGAEPPHSPSQAMEAASDLVESVTKGKGGPSGGSNASVDEHRKLTDNEGNGNESGNHQQESKAVTAGGSSSEDAKADERENVTASGSNSEEPTKQAERELPESARRRLRRLGCCDLLDHGIRSDT